jgi:hypothetical protein
MLKSILAVVGAAVIAAAIVGLIPPPEPAAAATETGASTLAAAPTLAAAASFAAATPTAAALPSAAAQTESEQRGCTRAWPYYEQSCLRNSRQTNGKTHVVRVIADDRSVANRALRARR